MRSLYNYIIYSENRYNNSTTVEDKELILNTEISERDYMYTNRIGKVISLPIMFDSEIKKKMKLFCITMSLEDGLIFMVKKKIHLAL